MRTKSPTQAEKILDEAARLFGSQRFHETRMEDIATAAAVGKGTLYRYFKDKEELYLALLDRAAAGMSCRVYSEMSNAEDPRSRLTAVIRAIVEYFDENPNLFDLIHRAEAMQNPRVTLASWHQTREETIQRLCQIFEEGRQAGAFKVADPELAAWMLLGALRAIIRFGSRPRCTDLTTRITDIFLEGADPFLAASEVRCRDLEMP